MRRNVRIAACMAALALTGVLLWAVAPAISLNTYAPEPVNFEQAVPASEKLSGAQSRTLRAATAASASEASDSDEGPVRYISDPIAAPKRFDLVGLPDQKSPVEMRARAIGGEWSRWVETTRGEPIWTGGTEELQLRSRDERPHGEIAYVNVSGDATAADGILNGVRGGLNAGFLSIAAVVSPEEAAADAPFEVVNRREWDPGHDCVPKKPVFGEVRAAVVHHTVNANDYSATEASRLVLGICRYHRYSHGWNDIGYNALVDRFGNVYAGRTGGLNNSVIGAHTAGYNSQTFGVSSIGDHTATGLSKAAIEAITNLLAWKLSLHGIDAVGRTTLTSSGKETVKEITRHRRLNDTACPGRAQVSKILALTQEKIASGTFTPPPPPPDDGGVIPG